MLKIFVGGGFNEDDANIKAEQQEFARELAKEIVDQGHILLSSCITDFDAEIAQSANEYVVAGGGNPFERIYSYVLAGQKPIYDFGNIRKSQLQNWDISSRRLRVPEPIALADAVILVGGFEGTHKAANWARIAKKPLLPITRFGGTAEEVYSEELDDFENRYGAHVSKGEFENLAQLKSPLPAFAKTVVSLAEKTRTSRSVFVVMSFADKPELTDALESFKSVCKEYGYECSIVSEKNTSQRILPEIWKRIKGCAFVIVDLSDDRPNVYYELGFAEGLGKPIIVTAKEGTDLPFDTKDIPVCFWNGQTALKEALSGKVKEIAEMQGR
jgi:hypothetical protein